MTSKLAIVVGGTSGIGKSIAHRIASHDKSVDIIVSGRNLEEGNKVVESLSVLSPGRRHEFIPVDASKVRSIQAYCDDIKKRKESRLHYLVLTQGMATIAGRNETDEKIDTKLALHFYGRMTFVRELLPALRSAAEGDSADVRVLSVLSAGVHSPYKKMREDPELIDNFSIKNAADAAGLYNDLYLDKCAKIDKHISFVHANPGFVATNWGTEMPFALRMVIRPLQWAFGKSLEECGLGMGEALFSDRYRADSSAGGVHLMGEKGEPVGKTSSHSDENVDFLFDHTNAVIDRAASIAK